MTILATSEGDDTLMAGPAEAGTEEAGRRSSPLAANELKQTTERGPPGLLRTQSVQRSLQLYGHGHITGEKLLVRACALVNRVSCACRQEEERRFITDRSG